MSAKSSYHYRKKVIELSPLKKIVNNLKSENRKIVFTNGCFDILHRGHIQYLRESRMLGDVLIVAINSDDSIKRLKGADRPIVSENDRAFLLEALDFVDYVIVFTEDTPLRLLFALLPDIYTKGGGYDLENVIGPGLGSSIVEDYGGEVVLIDVTEGYSSTSIIKQMEK